MENPNPVIHAVAPRSRSINGLMPTDITVDFVFGIGACIMEYAYLL